MPTYRVTRNEEMAVTYRVRADSPEAAKECLKWRADHEEAIEQIESYWGDCEDEEYWEVKEEEAAP